MNPIRSFAAMNKIILLIIILGFTFSPFLATAASPCTIAGLKANNNNISTLPQCINQIYIWSLGAGALIGFFITVLGGYYYMTSHGNAEQAAKGTELIWSAVIGLAILFTAYILLRIINPDLVNFQTNSFQGLNPPSSTTTPPIGQ